MAIACICQNPACSKIFDVYPYEQKRGLDKYCKKQCFFDDRPRQAEKRFWKKVNTDSEGCWEWKAGRFAEGYGNFSIQGIHIPAHRFAYETTYGLLLPGFLVCHHCDNPPCVRPDHLFPGTHYDNAKDAVSKGRLHSLQGYFTKIPDSDVPYICSMRGKITSIELGKIFNVSPITIRWIWQGKRKASQVLC